MPLFLQAFLSALPILIILVLMGLFLWPSRIVMFISWLVTALLALLFWRVELIRILASTIQGALMSLDILIIVFGAIFLISIMNRGKAMKAINHSLRKITNDPRIQIIIIAWAFGSFIEGLAGFGVAIILSASLLVGLGFPPLAAAAVSLIANSTPVSFGAVGTPIVIGMRTAIDGLLSAEIAMSDFLFSVGYWSAIIHFIIGLSIPIIMVMVLTHYFSENRHYKNWVEIIPFAIFSSLAFLIPYIITAFISSELPSIIGGIISLIIIAFAAKKGFLIPKSSWEFKDRWGGDWGKKTEKLKNPEEKEKQPMSPAIAWLPFIIIGLILTITRLGVGKSILQGITISWVGILGVDGINYTMVPLWLPGFIFLIVAICFLPIYKIKTKEIIKDLKTSFIRLIPASMVLVFSISMVRIMMNSGVNLSNYDSMLLVMSTWSFQFVGSAWPFISPFIGVIGTFVSGSNTVSNILFGGFQYSIASLLGISEIIILALQNIGGALGNMICIYNLVAVATVVGISGKEGKILQINLVPVVLLTLFAGILGLLFIYLT